MKKNTKKKFRDIRNAVVMMCVMVAMLSTASYAWFTMSDSPTVTGMQMTAATTGGGLEVANDIEGAEDTYAGAILIRDSNETKVLKPVTPAATAGRFQSPVYNGAIVDGLAEIPELETTQHVAKYTYWLQSKDTGNGNIGIGLILGDAKNQTNDMKLNGTTPSLNGSLVRKSTVNTESTPNTIDPCWAIRVGFVVYQDGTGDPSDLIIWEPNCDDVDTVAAATEVATSNIDDDIATSKLADPVLQSKQVGTVVKGGSGNISNTLFTMAKGGKVKIEMYVWLQGSDVHCGDEIQAGNLEAQVQFTVVDDAATTS